MSVTKEAVALSGSALDFARSLVEAGEYDTLDAAVSGILDGARKERAAEWKLIEEEVRHRLELPKDRYIRGHPGYFTRWFDEEYDKRDGSDT